MLPSEILKDILVSEGFIFGGLTDWAIFIARRPESPDAVVVLYDSGGKSPNPRWLIDYPSVQIKIRGDVNQYKAAYEKAQEVKNILLGRPSFTTTNSDRVVHINMLGDITFLGYDKKDQPEFVLNFDLILEPNDSINDNRDPL